VSDGQKPTSVGLGITIVLIDGQLDQATYRVTIPSLDDLPERFEYAAGGYVRWIAEDGRQMHSSEGALCYRWVSDS
jgi:hypothetical protein